MDKEVILCFINNRAREYKIITNGKVLHFITEGQKEKFMIGRHNAKLYYDAQDLFDADFFRTVKEILNGE